MRRLSGTATMRLHRPGVPIHRPVARTHRPVAGVHRPVARTHGPVAGVHGLVLGAHGVGLRALLRERCWTTGHAGQRILDPREAPRIEGVHTWGCTGVGMG